MVALVEFKVTHYGPREEVNAPSMFINAAMVGVVSAERVTEGEERCQLLLIDNPMGIPYLVVEGTLPEVANKLAAGDEIVAIGGDKEALEGKEPGDIAEREEAPREDEGDKGFMPAVAGADVKPTATDTDPGVAGKDLAHAGAAKPTPKAEPSKG